LQHPPTQMTEMVHLTGWLIYVFEIPVWPNIFLLCLRITIPNKFSQLILF